MTDDNLRAATLHSIAEVLEIEESELRGSDRIREDLGMDSLGSLELLSVLSESLRIDLEVDRAMKIVTVDDACQFVEASWAEQKRPAATEAPRHEG